MKGLFISIISVGLMTGVLLAQNKAGGSANLPSGYGSVQWGTTVSAARDNIRGKLVYTDEKSVIVSKQGNIEYTYGFLYKDPVLIGSNAKKEVPEAGAQATVEGKLFFVVVRFPYLSFEDVKKKLTEKYGEPGSENLINNQGAVAWSSASTLCIMWVDRYERKPYCGRIVYVGREIAKELPDYTKKIFNAKELEVIKTLVP